MGEGEDVPEEEWQFRALCLGFLHRKHLPSFMHFAHSTGVSLDKEIVSTSMAFGSWWEREGV